MSLLDRKAEDSRVIFVRRRSCDAQVGMRVEKYEDVNVTARLT